jgi:serine/threonine-protein kinase
MGTTSDRFEDHGEIGRGGMSIVRRVFDTAIGRDVAVKELPAESADDDRGRFLEEARTVGQLDHPNIPPVYDIERDHDGAVSRMIMKLVRGRTLASMIHAKAEPPLSGQDLEDVLSVFLKVCDAVAFAHSRGVIHRDLKPENIMVGEFGEVYVMDWGLALVRGTPLAESAPIVLVPRAPDSFDETGSLMGTINRMAPEQAWGRLREIDERTDVFGLGGILYECLTLASPYRAAADLESLELARAGLVPAPSELLPECVFPDALCRIAVKALARAPEDRYQSVLELKRDVESFLRGGGWFVAQRFAADAVIIRQGDVGDFAYIVQGGRCEVYRDVDGTRTVIRTIGPGEVFGEIGLFTSAKRTASVRALTDVSALLVTRASLNRELTASSWVRAFVQTSVERYLEADRRTMARS